MTEDNSRNTWSVLHLYFECVQSVDNRPVRSVSNCNIQKAFYLKKHNNNMPSFDMCHLLAIHLFYFCQLHGRYMTQWKPLIMIIVGLALFDNNNRLITLSGGYKNLHYLTEFIVTV